MRGGPPRSERGTVCRLDEWPPVSGALPSDVGGSDLGGVGPWWDSFSNAILCDAGSEREAQGIERRRLSSGSKIFPWSHFQKSARKQDYRHDGERMESSTRRNTSCDVIHKWRIYFHAASAMRLPTRLLVRYVREDLRALSYLAPSLAERRQDADGSNDRRG